MNGTGSSTPTLLPEKTEVLYDPNEIVRRVIESCHTVKYTMDCCVDTNGLSIFVIPNHLVTQAYIDMKNRGVKLRFISEITKDNLSYCKELMKIGEVRHLDEVKGNFGIADERLYHAGATANRSAPPPELIVSTVKAIVDQQQYFFDMLWKKTLPAKQRIKEIEHGLKREFMETIQDPYEVQTIFNNILKSANEEILITLPTKTNTFLNKKLYRYEQEYLLPLLRDAAARRIKLKFLVDKSAGDSMNKGLLIAKINSNIVETQILDGQHQNKIITAIVDKEVCLTVEVRDNDDYDEYDSAIEVLGLATYSNSESTVLSYASIFDTLWIQAELREVSSIT
ncbi:MAG: hypothetical protein WA395_01805 [Nitrososphaeraceae archaeon]